METDAWHPTDYHLHDRALAVQRIVERPKDFYKVKSPDDLRLTDDDFRRASEICAGEAQIVHEGTNLITAEGIKNGLVYCLLTPHQNWEGQVKGFCNLTTNPKPVEQMSRDEIQTILEDSGVTLAPQKSRYIAEALPKAGLRDYPTIIGDNIGHGWEVESTLRGIIIDDFRGLGLKTTSLLLRMCGANDLVPVDAWMMEMLYFHGYPCEAPRRKALVRKWKSDQMVLKTRKSGIRNSEYLAAEKFTADLAQKYGVSPVLLQAAYYGRGSGYSSQNPTISDSL